jgi:hypothetical protein
LKTRAGTKTITLDNKDKAKELLKAIGIKPELKVVPIYAPPVEAPPAPPAKVIKPEKEEISKKEAEEKAKKEAEEFLRSEPKTIAAKPPPPPPAAAAAAAKPPPKPKSIITADLLKELEDKLSESIEVAKEMIKEFKTN